MKKTAVRPRLEAERDKIIDAYTNGRTLAELAREYACSLSPLRAFLKSNGVTLRAPMRRVGSPGKSE